MRAALTGESIPVDKAAGDKVIAATINQSGFLRCRGHPCGRGHHPVPDHQDGQRCRCHQGPHCKDRRHGVRCVRACGHYHCSDHHRRVAAAGPERGLCTGPRHLRAGHQLSLCAGSGNARCHHGRQRHGCQKRHPVQDRRFTGSSRHSIQIVALDKTGTITSGEPKVTDILPAEGVSEDGAAAPVPLALEQKSEHPLAKAIAGTAARHSS